jgi:outer membrane protein assembly factor BamB
MPDGRIAVLTYRHRSIRAIHPTIPVRDHFIQKLTAEGEPVEEASLTDILLNSPDVFRLQDVKPREKDGIQEIDLLHSNSIEWMRNPELAKRNSLYAPTNVLLCIRHQDAVVIVDWSTRKVVWSWGQGEISGPHDATLLSNGNILVFDNGLGRKWSRVVEVDPIENQIRWQYKASNSSAFFTVARGASQRVPNGNTLITNSQKGMLFEVTPDGKMVWLYKNPTPAEGHPRSAIVRARRVFEAESGDGARFLVSD